MACIDTGVVVDAKTLNVYKRLNADTVVTVSGDRFAIWNIEGDEAMQLVCKSIGNSGKTIDQLIEEAF